MKREELLKLMAVIGLEYPQQFDVSEERLNLWNEILGHCDYRVAQEATIRVLSKPTQWPPKAGELLAEAKAVALEWARDRRKEQEAREARQQRLESKPVQQMTEAEFEASRERVKALVNDCLEKIGRRRVA